MLSFALSGCGFGVITELKSQDDSGWVFDLYFTVDVSLENTLNDSASYSEVHNKQWTLADWLCDYFDAAGKIYGFTYEFSGINAKRDPHVYEFEITVPATADESLTDGLILKGNAEVTANNGFIRTVSVVRDDRYNFFITDFENSYRKYVSAGEVAEDSKTLMEILLFGVQTDSVKLAGITEAFPELPIDEYTQTILTEFWLASSRMNVAYAEKVATSDRKYAYYIFEKEMGDGAGEVEYDYFIANPTGWYLIAIAAGGIAVVAVYLYARYANNKKRKPPKPTTKDLYPYDPFDGYGDPFA